MSAKICLLSLILTLPSFAFANHGVIKVVKGQAFVLSGKTQAKTQAKVGQKVHSSDSLITLKDSRIKVVMVDGNELNVSPESQVEISKYQFEDQGKKKNVLLNVLKGKVRSKVKQKYDGDQNKFQVKTKTAVAGVRGTDFLASYNPANNQSNVITFEGKVEFGLPGANGQILNPVPVIAGQSVSQIGAGIPSAPQTLPATELASLDTDTDAEKAPEVKRLPSNEQPVREQKEQPKKALPVDKNTEVKTPKDAPKDQRLPSSIPGQPTMIIDSDLPSAENNDFIDSFPTNDALLPIGATDPIGEYERLPICEFCNDVINTNDAYLRIRVKK